MGSVSKNFPQPDIDNYYGMAFLSDELDHENCPSVINTPGPKAECGCPTRATAPDPPELEKPFDAYSVTELKNILMNHYGPSTFNTAFDVYNIKSCQKWTENRLSCMWTQKFSRPITVPAHWSTKVKNDLDRDVILGVIEPVPLNTPVRWCARMVVTKKHNRDPRRTGDLQPLINAFSPTIPTVPHNTCQNVFRCLEWIPFSGFTQRR